MPLSLSPLAFIRERIFVIIFGVNIPANLIIEVVRFTDIPLVPGCVLMLERWMSCQPRFPRPSRYFEHTTQRISTSECACMYHFALEWTPQG